YPLQDAANESTSDFRLNRLYTEVRSGDRAQTRLARIAAAGFGPKETLSDADWVRLAASRRTHVLAVSGGRRGVARTLQAPGRGPVTMFVADRTTLVDETLSSIRVALIEFGAAGLLLALVGGYWVARRGLRPIKIFTAQAAAMAASPAEGARLAIPDRQDE